MENYYKRIDKIQRAAAQAVLVAESAEERTAITRSTQKKIACIRKAARKSFKHHTGVFH